MKAKIIVIISIALFISTIQHLNAHNERKNDEVRVLYVGGKSDWKIDEEELQNNPDKQIIHNKNIQKRSDAFAKLLRKFFNEVATIDAVDYKMELSKNYDVTIFDGLPPVIEQAKRIYNDEGKVIDYKPARYITEDFISPTITIGSLSDQLGRSAGIKNDWYCLCLDRHAHSFNSNHPIFNEPHKINMTLVKLPTPEDAYNYSYYHDGQMPDSLMMWQVLTKGYKTDKNFNVGLVSRPWGYMDSPDTEYISSGVCQKTLDAVAIGRHGNFMTWGFDASPLYMTEEAKIVFINAIVYMSKFKGGVIARKYNDRIATREYIKELKYLASKESYDERVILNKEFNEMLKLEFETLKEKSKQGEKLSKYEQNLLSNYNPNASKEEYTYADHLKRYQKDLYNIFGENPDSYLKYYDENKDFFYGGEGSYKLSIDQDAKAWGISNNNKEILNKAIRGLESNKEVERSLRILRRYTLCNFETPREWRDWYDTYNNKMFFTESGGWFFLINDTKEIDGNNYSSRSQASTKQNTLKSKANTPTDSDPVALSINSKKINNNTKEVTIEMSIYNGYYVYNIISEEDAFTPLQINFELPKGYELIGETIYPHAAPLGSGVTTVFREKVSFTQKIKTTTSPGDIKVKISYQCCDNHVCMPPKTVEFKI